MTLNRLWAPRARGYLRDCVGYLGIAMLEVPIGVVLIGSSLASNPVFLAVASSVPPVAATIIAARAEAGRSHATWGKRKESLLVVSVRGMSVGLGRALGRNTIKIAVPWTLGHVVAFGAVNGGFQRGDLLTVTVAGLLYGLLLATTLMNSSALGAPSTTGWPAHSSSLKRDGTTASATSTSRSGSRAISSNPTSETLDVRLGQV